MRVGDVRRIVAATGIDLTGDPVALCEDLDMAEFQFATYKAWHKRKRKLPLNATEWLVGARLPELFEKYFNRHAGRSRNADNSLRSTPCIRFIQACVAAMAPAVKPCSAGTIARNMTKANRRWENFLK
jgi:hypothetical protein